MSDPNLIDPTATTTDRVQPIPTFRHIDENGKMIESTKPLPATKGKETKFYYNSARGASIHRTDGVRLAFINHIHETDIIASQAFLEDEIALGHPNIRVANETEVHGYKMARDPRGTMEAELRPKIESELREKLTQEILAQLAGGTQESDDKLNGAGAADTPSAQTSAAALLAKIRSGNATLVMTASAERLNPVSSADIKDAAMGNGEQK